METTPRSDDERDALLADAHARYHCDPGNMLWASDCIWEGCLFWEIASFTEDHLRSAGYRKHPDPEITDEGQWEYRTTVGGYDPQPHARLTRGEATEAEVLAMLADDPRPLILERRRTAGPWAPVRGGKQ